MSGFRLSKRSIPHGRVDIPGSLHYVSMYVSTPVWLMPLMAEAATAEEVVDEETTCQSLPLLRASGPAGAPMSLPVPGAAQLLTLASPVSLAVSLGVAGAWPAGMRAPEDPSPSPKVRPVG